MLALLNIINKRRNILLAKNYIQISLSISRKLFLFIWSVLFFSLTFAQSPQPSFKNFTVEDGLPSSEIYFVLQDHDKYMWFATDRGLVKYNGYEFTTYTIKDGLIENVVFELYEDYKNRLWIISSNGTLCYRENGKINTYAHNDKLQQYFPGPKIIHSFYIDALDNIYIGTMTQGLIVISKEGNISTKFNSTESKQFLSFKKIDSTILSYEEIGIDKINPISFYRKKSFIKYKEKIISLQQKESPNRSKAIEVDDSVFCYNMEKSLILYNHKTNSIIDSLNLKNKIVSFQKIDNQYFIGLQNAGLVNFTIQNNKIIVQNNFLKEYTCSSVGKDFENGYWITTTQHGVFYTSSLNVFSITKNEGLYKDYIKELGIYDKHLLLNYGDTILPLFSNCNHCHDRLENNLSQKKRQLTSSYFFKGCLLMAHNNQIIDTCDGFVFPCTKTSGVKFASMKDNKLIFHSTQIIYQYKDSKLSLFGKEYYYNQLEDSEVLDENSLWVATKKGLFKQTQDTSINMSYLDTCFSYRTVDLAKTDRFGLVIATRGAGVILFNSDTIIKINTENHLLTNDITCVFVDSIQNIWVATNLGLYKIDAFNPNKIDYYSINNGLVSNEITTINSIGKLLYVGTKKGLSIIEIHNDESDSLIINPVIINVTLNNEIVMHNSVIDVYYNDRGLNISYIGLSYKAASNIEYKYRIKELSTGWQYTKNREFKLQFFPPPGIYSIEILARSLPYGKWSDKPALVSLIIHAPFYLTWWFLLGMFFCFSFLVYWAFKFNLLAYNKHIQQEIANRILRKLSRKTYLIIEMNKQEVRINENDILYIEAFKDYVEIITTTKKYLYRSTMIKMEEKLSSTSFVRVHRSFIVQKDKIDSISQEALTVKSHKIPIGKTYRLKLKELKNQFSRLNT